MRADTHGGRSSTIIESVRQPKVSMIEIELTTG